MNDELAVAIQSMYAVFARYSRPDDVSICPTCAEAGTDPAHLAHADLPDLSGGDLVAIHVLALPDDALRHFIPRVFEVVLGEQWHPFEFGLSGLQGRTADWRTNERDVIERVLKTTWAVLLSSYPISIGYVSSVPDLLELAVEADVPIAGFLNDLDTQQIPSAQLHLADLVDFAYTTSTRVDIVSPVREWLARPVVGRRLEEAFYRAGDHQEARIIADAHELWETCHAAPGHLH